MRHLELPGRREHGLKGDFRQWEPLFLAKAGGSTRANTVEKTSRNAEPSVDAIYNAYPNQGPGFYRYVERHSGRRNYYLGRSRSIAAK